MKLKTWGLKKSIWVFHVSSGACNNCDIEVLDCLTPKFDIERFGMVLVGSVRHADVLLCCGAITKQAAPRIKRLYEQAAKPCFVVAIGGCACSGGIFKDSYSIAGPYDKIIPVHAYIPGCPPKPEAIIAGVVKLLSTLK